MAKGFLNKSFLLLGLSFVTLHSAFCQRDLIKTIYFKPNSHSIDKKYLKSLNVISQQLISDSFGFLKVFGYATTKGSEEHNEDLSEKRAIAVYDYLSTHAKFDTTAAYVTWIGESDEIYDLHFPSAHFRQSCVDIWVMFRRKKVATKPK